MRSSFLSSLAAALLLGAASADAGTLTMATWTQIVSPEPGFGAPAVPLTRTAAQLGAAGSSTGGSVSLSLVFPQFTTSFFVPKTPNGVLDLHIKVTQGGPQALTATPAMAAADQGVPGTVIVRTAQHIGMGVNASMFAIGVTLPHGGLTLTVGRAAQVTRTFQQIATHTLTLDFYAWTPGTLSFTGLTSKGVALPDVVAMGSFSLSAAGGGTVTLVSPTKLSINGALAQTRRVLNLTTLKLTFVPEPGALLLLAAGAAALAWRRG